MGKCKFCGCTDNNCIKCIKKTGEPCYWVEIDVCSACFDFPENGIQGFYGCNCHPFKSWEDLKFYEKQKFVFGDKVKHRCGGRKGIILGNSKTMHYPSDLSDEASQVINKNWYSIKYGELPKDHQIIHVSNAIKI